MYREKNAKIAQTANQLIWPASRMRKLNKKQANQMHSKSQANIGQIANQLIWAASGVRKLNKKQANVLKNIADIC